MQANTGHSKKNFVSSTTLLLFFSALLIRLPFFFRDYIDGDESTFILMGQSVADGYLPYDRLWDLKPPMLFYLFGLIEYVFPHSFFAIRFFGVLAIFGSSMILLNIARAAGMKNGLLVALSYVILSSMFGSVQGVMSEHIAVFFMLAGLLFFIKNKTALNLFIAGMLFGCAVLCKMNYGYAIPAILLYHFIAGRPQGIVALVKNAACTVAGTLLIFLLAASPFLIHDKWKLFFDSVFLAPLEYSRAMHIPFLLKLKKTWWVIVAVSGLSFFTFKKTRQKLPSLSILIVLTTVYTFFSTGAVNGHYLVQVYPFIAILVFGFLIPKEFDPSVPKLAIFVFLISVESMIEYYRLGKHYHEEGTLYNGRSVYANNVLKAKGLASGKIFFADYHIGYWSLRQYPLTKSTTHPSNIIRPYLFKYFGAGNSNSMQELKYILNEIGPDIIVSKYDYLAMFNKGTAENLYADSVMADRYRIIQEDPVKRIYIWQKR
ncbi:MAG: glycosyltransferase family 39 protein [Chitinophagaceae bacterium]|nr:glycosyltransferase family 39 protein [Chitinophagaceae bacterium]